MVCTCVLHIALHVLSSTSFSGGYFRPKKSILSKIAVFGCFQGLFLGNVPPRLAPYIDSYIHITFSQWLKVIVSYRSTSDICRIIGTIFVTLQPIMGQVQSHPFRLQLSRAIVGKLYHYIPAKEYSHIIRQLQVYSCYNETTIAVYVLRYTYLL